MTANRSPDENIGEMFDSSYKSEPNPAVLDNFDDSVRFYHDYIISKTPDSVLDIGMGAGGLILALQNSGIKQVYGIELSHEGVELARKRFELFGDINRSKFFKGNFLDFPIQDVDVITLHRVIHCYPEYEEIVQRVAEFNPGYILYSIPRDTIRAKILLGTISFLSGLITGFRAYVHPPGEIKKILLNKEYELDHHSVSGFWETFVFRKENDK